MFNRERDRQTDRQTDRLQCLTKMEREGERNGGWFGEDGIVIRTVGRFCWRPVWSVNSHFGCEL